MKIVNPGIRDRIEYLTGRLHVFADMALTFRDQEQIIMRGKNKS